MQTFDFFNSRDTDMPSTHYNTTHYPNIYPTYPIPCNTSGVEVKSCIAQKNSFLVIFMVTKEYEVKCMIDGQTG